MTRQRHGHQPRRFEDGTGNVFADIGLPDPEGALAKARLAEAIDETIGRRGLTQTDAAVLLGVDQPTISRIVNGRLDGFSQERLVRYLVALGDDVEIVVRRPDRYDREGRVSVTVE